MSSGLSHHPCTVAKNMAPPGPQCDIQTVSDRGNVFTGFKVQNTGQCKTIGLDTGVYIHREMCMYACYGRTYWGWTLKLKHWVNTVCGLTPIYVRPGGQSSPIVHSIRQKIQSYKNQDKLPEKQIYPKAIMAFNAKQNVFFFFISSVQSFYSVQSV